MRERRIFGRKIKSLAGRDRESSSFSNRYFGEIIEPEISFENEIDANLGKTLYLPIKLSKTVLPKVGVFIPNGFQPATAIKNARAFSAIDLVVFFHGHIYPCDTKGVAKFDKGGIEYYWNTPDFTFLREDFAASGRNAVLIAPTFTNKLNRSSATFGNLDENKKFDLLINECLAQLKKDNHLPNDAEARNIILAGHSAGGLPMQSILWAINSMGRNIVECWGFESLYFGTDIWWGWMNFNPDKKFIHYRQKKAFVSQSERLKKHGNFQDVSDGKGHCSLVKEKWHTSIENCRWLKTLGASKTKNGESSDYEITDGDYRNVFEREFALEKAGLFKGKIVVAKIPADKKKREKARQSGGAYVEVKESPSVFMPEIIRRARDKALRAGKNDIAAKLNPDNWFNNFTRDFTFLGRKLKKGQFVHIELGRLLKTLETKFTTDLGISDAKKVGDILLKNSTEGISGSRLTSSTATFSMHMFGLAVDVNYLGNPFVEGGINSKKKPPEEFGDVIAVNNILRNAAALMNTTPVLYNQHVKDKFADRYDYVAALDATIENYFKLLDDSAALDNYLRASNSADWRGLSDKKAREKIQKNLDHLAGFLARKDYKDYFKKHAILDFDKRFVVGMEKAGLHWGGDYGDMMHFDLRKTGVGKYVDEARAEYSGKVRRQAERLFKEKKYGEHSPD